MITIPSKWIDYGVAPRQQVYILSAGLLISSIVWLLGAFMAYLLIYATSIKVYGSFNFYHAKQAVTVLLFAVLFLVYMNLGIGLASFKRWAMRHTQAGAVTLVVLGGYLFGVWQGYSPWINQSLLTKTTFTPDQLVSVSTGIGWIILAMMVILPLLTYLILSGQGVKNVIPKEDKDTFNFMEMWFLWMQGSLGLLCVSGVLFDTTYFDIKGREVSSQYFWLLLSLLLCLSWLGVRFKWRFLAYISLFVNAAIMIVGSMLLAFDWGHLDTILPSPAIYIESVGIGLLYFSSVLFCGFLFYVWQIHRAK